MSQINRHNVYRFFQSHINLGDIRNCKVTEREEEIADQLVKLFHELCSNGCEITSYISLECVDNLDIDNRYDEITSEVEQCVGVGSVSAQILTVSGDPGQRHTISLDKMEEVVNHWRDVTTKSHRTIKKMRNRFGAIILNKSMLYKWETIVAKGRNIRQKLEKIS